MEKNEETKESLRKFKGKDDDESRNEYWGTAENKRGFGRRGQQSTSIN
jgi:hypothetical protein